MEPRNKRIAPVLLALMLLAALMPVRAQALGRIDTQRAVTLTIRYSHGKEAMAGVEFALYRVADVLRRSGVHAGGGLQGLPRVAGESERFRLAEADRHHGQAMPSATN